MKSTSLFVLLASLLSACGGDGGADPDTAAASAGSENSGDLAEGSGDEAMPPVDGDVGGETAEATQPDAQGDEARDDVQGGEAAAGGEPAVTSAVPAICASADDCPADIECVKQADTGEFGYCDVGEIIVTPDEEGAASSAGGGGVSLAAPAVCASDDDCPVGIDCAKFDEADEFGYCNVDEMVVEPSEE